MRPLDAPCSLAALFLLLGLGSGCGNNPYRPGETAGNTLFTSYAVEPTKLEPANAYFVHETQFIGQIYEPPFGYHYLKRPYELIPQTAEAVPQAVYLDAGGQVIDEPDPPAAEVAAVEYTVGIRPGIRYQPHPCFAVDEDGSPVYRAVQPADIAGYDYPSRFARQGTRELRAADYVLQARRLADPRLASPVFSGLSRYIEGFTELQEAYTRMLEAERSRRREAAGPGYNQARDERENPIRLDYMAPEFPGFTVIDDYRYRVRLTRKYPQILYWMAMHFFGPVPQEALDFYEQPAMVARQFTLNRCPVGTGPYYIDVYRPNERIELLRNPHYRDERYPAEGAPGDAERGLLADAGRAIPFIDRQVYTLEKEAIPRWNKFLQGYYDLSGIAGDVFDQAVNTQVAGDAQVSPEMASRGIGLTTAVDTTFYYLQFNMLDDVVGGYGPGKAKLRQALSIALDYNEYLDIFSNGRGVAAQGPLPPGIFGYREGAAGTNPYVAEWNPRRGRHENRGIGEARRLMAEAGYPEGRGPDGQPLTLHLDHARSGDATFRSVFEWTRNRLDLLGVRLRERPSDLSRMREKRLNGNWQLLSSGWLADYPDPENFLFLFYGPNGIVKHRGANSVNYENEEFDRLFEALESLQNTPRRQELIDGAMDILRRDAPAVWMFHPVTYSLTHGWLANYRPHQMSHNVVKYWRIDAGQRADLQQAWNRPVRWPLAALLLGLLAAIVPVALRARRRERGRAA